ncbi:PREDICTED: calmodulin-lysine N-methyltransferase [Ceratosolen solmsi marchali]|uniref:Calmodulin-lysine N-methyltransferase n=1 Tax=Ceratosolen solmsi marchali TaxID=326594 RepID=A0AAJ7DXD1_9HYME|nr:PREDICTED: calmodulin-lysine N-methyltransferase [Ceratosolen solmsi marchali]
MTSELLYESSAAPRSEDGERKVAQKRWRLLARALTRSLNFFEDEVLGKNEEISARRFTTFDLLHQVHLENEDECTWWLYTGLLEGELYEVLVRRISKCFTANELIGFNNTGNVCVWPSEECLAYYLLKNPEICRRRKVLELGGGMSCLAGVLAAKYCEPSSVTLTDGNARSVENVRCIVERNGMAGLTRCAVVQWARAAKALRQSSTAACSQEFNGEASYEVILCADCLFFDEARLDLVDTINGWLADDGVALVMAPRRGTTFREFAEAAVQRGFIARQVESYDTEVWSRHLDLLATNRDYCPDIHFPVLLELTKQKKIPPG